MVFDSDLNDINVDFNRIVNSDLDPDRNNVFPDLSCLYFDENSFRQRFTRRKRENNAS